MYLPYKQISKFYFKKALICVDSFHLIKHLNESLQKVRIRVLRSYDTDSIQYYLLKKWKCLLFDRTINLDNKGKFNHKLQRHINFRQLLELILAIHSDLKNAYQLKEKYIIFNATSSYEEAKQNFDGIYNDFVEANVREYSEFVATLSNWRTEIINSFIVYRGKRINSSVAESMNATISTLIFNTRGIRNSERRRKRIMYAVNKSGFSLK
jgi:transposase